MIAVLPMRCSDFAAPVRRAKTKPARRSPLVMQITTIAAVGLLAAVSLILWIFELAGRGAVDFRRYRQCPLRRWPLGEQIHGVRRRRHVHHHARRLAVFASNSRDRERATSSKLGRTRHARLRRRKRGITRGRALESPQHQVDRRLGLGRGYSSQVLTGRVELKYRHILAFLEVIDVEPGMFFRVLFPDSLEERQGTGGRMVERLFRQLHRAGYGEPAELPRVPPVLDTEELERRIREAIRQALGSAEPPPGES